MHDRPRMAGAHLLDRARRQRSPTTVPGFHRGRPLRDKGLEDSAEPADGRRRRRGHAPHRARHRLIDA